MINCRTGPFDPPISPAQTIPDGIESPERNKKEVSAGKEGCWQKARTVLFLLTRELNKIMSMIISVAGEELDPGQSGHAHLPGIH